MHDYIDAAMLAISMFDLSFVGKLLAGYFLIAGLLIWRLWVINAPQFESECRDEEFDRAIRGLERMQ